MGLPLDFLQTASRTSLEGYEMARLNEADKIEKQLRALLKEWLLCRAGADVARILIENESLRSITLDPRQEQFDFSEERWPGRTASASDAKPIRRHAAD